jgi:hypothetical protein
MRTPLAAAGARSIPNCFEALESRTLLSAAAPQSSDSTSFLAQLPREITHVVSTVPGNGDVNPYGVAFVPQQFPAGGKIHPGDVLISNFNNSKNLQGTGTTIVDVSPSGKRSLFFQGNKGLGLTTALGVLRGGFVLVGNVPAPDGMHVHAPGSLLVIDRNGHVVKTLTNAKLLDGPWDLTVDDDADDPGFADVFVSNVLNGTVTRLVLKPMPQADTVKVESATQIASGYMFRTDPAALVVGPTGLALDERRDILYVASTGDNAIYAIPNAEHLSTRTGRGKLIYKDNAHLRGPLALALAPNGDLLTANGDAVNGDTTNQHNSEIIEFTPTGKFVDSLQINPTAGGAFGLAINVVGNEVSFAAVNDITNEIDIWDFDM